LDGLIDAGSALKAERVCARRRNAIGAARDDGLDHRIGLPLQTGMSALLPARRIDA
jgi:hypothetical protein